MLHRRKLDFTSLVWTVAAEVGMNPAKITDRVLRDAFPRTWEEAEIEGANIPQRNGVMLDVRRIIKSAPPEDAQIDFGDIAPEFRDITRSLHKAAYYVEHLEAQVPVPMLIKDPALLDSAREYMRRKGQECLAEADILDLLYEAVVAGLA